jgi:glutamate synthase (NADPH/NADH) large chain
MANLGFRKFEEMIGHTRPSWTRSRRSTTGRRAGLDFSRVLYKPEAPAGVAISNTEEQKHGLDVALDNRLIEQARSGIENQAPVHLEMPIVNTNLAVGAMLSGEVARRYGHAGLPADTIHIKLAGTAGQSFGAWLAHGVTLHLEGDANDYVGKGLSGGRIIIEAEPVGPIIPRENDHRRQHRPVRRNLRRLLLQRGRAANGSPCVTRGPSPSLSGSVITAAST